jgi:hypothetical protein
MQESEIGRYRSLRPLRSCPPCSASRASRCALAACGGASPLALQTHQPPAGAQQTAAEEQSMEAISSGKTIPLSISENASLSMKLFECRPNGRCTQPESLLDLASRAWTGH